VPAIPAEHFYVTTSCFEPKLDSLLPCVRDYDSHTYVREWEGGFMVGGFELEAKPAFGGSGIPEDWKNKLPQDWNHFCKFLTVVRCRYLD
jgi:pyruvate dehydrogenase phosphatase regulatory subunit